MCSAFVNSLLFVCLLLAIGKTTNVISMMSLKNNSRRHLNSLAELLSLEYRSTTVSVDIFALLYFRASGPDRHFRNVKFSCTY